MPAHKFQVGEIVQLSPFIGRNVSGGSYEVVKQLSEINGEFQYRIKSMNEPHERVVGESEYVLLRSIPPRLRHAR
jgi:hypothetical protein